jgi:hypothetical protein
VVDACNPNCAYDDSDGGGGTGPTQRGKSRPGKPTSARGNRLHGRRDLLRRRNQRYQTVAIRTSNKMIEHLIAVAAGESAFHKRRQQPGVGMIPAGRSAAQTPPGNLG